MPTPEPIAQMQAGAELDAHDLQMKLIYSIIVAGKSAAFADTVIRKLFPSKEMTPFQHIRVWENGGQTINEVKAARTGNYAKLARALRELSICEINLAKCSPMELEKIHGIGPKTSRFFILWTRPGARYAALDTHVLKWLRYLGHNAPNATPQSSIRYANLEGIMLLEADQRGMTARDLDASIWDWCSSGKHTSGEWPQNLMKHSAPAALLALNQSTGKE